MVGWQYENFKNSINDIFEGPNFNVPGYYKERFYIRAYVLFQLRSVHVVAS